MKSRISFSRRRLLAVLTGLTASLLPRSAAASGNTYYQGPVTDHFDGTRFLNPGSANKDQGLTDVLKWRLGAHTVAWPDRLPDMAQDRPPTRVKDGDCRVSFVGHATFLVQVDGLNILLDPSGRRVPACFLLWGQNGILRPA